MPDNVSDLTKVQEPLLDEKNAKYCSDDIKHEPSESSQKVPKETSLFAKIKLIKDNITLEPMLACYIMPSAFSQLATQNLALEKACRVNLGYEDHICDALIALEVGNYTKEESAVQDLAANLRMWKQIIETSLSCFLILFIGAWSDKMGRRKVCMLAPLVGELLSSSCSMLSRYFFYEWPMEVGGILEALFPALAGSWYAMYMAAYSYIADVTTEETRTFRIGIVELFSMLGAPLGTALSGILLTKIGYFGVFGLSISFYVVGFLYGYYKISEVERDGMVKQEYPKTIRRFLKSFFDFTHINNTLSVALRNGTKIRRLRICLLMVVTIVVFGPGYGEGSVLYLFTRHRFNWDELQFSVYSTFTMIIDLVGTLFSITIFSRLTQLDDGILGVIAGVSRILSSFVYAFATTNLEMYIAPIISIFSGTSYIAMRSTATKIVSSEERGQINSLFSLAEALTPLAYVPMYTQVYIRTKDRLPGAFYMLGSVLTLPAVVIFWWMYRVNKREKELSSQSSNHQS